MCGGGSGGGVVVVVVIGWWLYLAYYHTSLCSGHFIDGMSATSVKHIP